MGKVETIDVGAATLAELLERVEEGVEVLIRRDGRIVARATPIVHPEAKRQLGILEGKIVVSDNVDDPLPEDVLASIHR